MHPPSCCSGFQPVGIRKCSNGKKGIGDLEAVDEIEWLHYFLRSSSVRVPDICQRRSKRAFSCFKMDVQLFEQTAHGGVL